MFGMQSVESRYTDVVVGPGKPICVEGHAGKLSTT